MINRGKISSLLRLSFSIPLFLLLSCQTLRIKKDSPFLSFKLVIQTPQKTSLKTYAYLKKEEVLRVDITQPLLGPVIRLFLSSDTMLVQLPIHRKYYKGPFESQVFLPQFDSLPYEWFISLLKDRTSSAWNCRNPSLPRCLVGEKHKGEAVWLQRKRNFHKVRLSDSQTRSLSLKIKWLSSRDLEERFFKPQLKNYTALSLSQLKKNLRRF